MTEQTDHEITTEKLTETDFRITLKSKLGFCLWVVLYDPDIPRKHSRLYMQYRLFAEVGGKIDGQPVSAKLIHAANDKPFLHKLIPWHQSEKTPHQRLGSCLCAEFEDLKRHYWYHSEEEKSSLYNAIVAFAKKIQIKKSAPNVVGASDKKPDPTRKVFA